MVHVAQADKFFEQDYYTPADDGFQVFETEFGRIGLVICSDRHYPESIRTEALKGADLILIPTVNTKTEPSDQGQETVYESAEKRVLCVRKAAFKFSKSSRPALRKFTVQQVEESGKRERS